MFCALAIVYIMLHMQVSGGSYTTVQDHARKEANTDGALQGTGPLYCIERTGWCVCIKNTQ